MYFFVPSVLRLYMLDFFVSEESYLIRYIFNYQRYSRLSYRVLFCRMPYVYESFCMRTKLWTDKLLADRESFRFILPSVIPGRFWTGIFDWMRSGWSKVDLQCIFSGVKSHRRSDSSYIFHVHRTISVHKLPGKWSCEPDAIAGKSDLHVHLDVTLSYLIEFITPFRLADAVTRALSAYTDRPTGVPSEASED